MGAEISRQSLDALLEILLQLVNGNTEYYRIKQYFRGALTINQII
jgi:hypothetical protein